MEGMSSRFSSHLGLLRFIAVFAHFLHPFTRPPMASTDPSRPPPFSLSVTVALGLVYDDLAWWWSLVFCLEMQISSQLDRGLSSLKSAEDARLCFKNHRSSGVKIGTAAQKFSLESLFRVLVGGVFVLLKAELWWPLLSFFPFRRCGCCRNL